MKATYKLAWDFIRHGKKQTWLVASGIFISVFFLSSLLLFINADEKFEKERELYLHYDYEIFYSDLKDDKKINDFINEKYTDQGYVTEDFKLYEYGITYTDNERILVSAYEQVPQNRVLSLQVGRYPENEHEILVSDRYLSQYDLEIGDSITLSVLPFTSSDTIETTYKITGSHYDYGLYTNRKYIHHMITYSPECDSMYFTNGFIKIKDMSTAEMDSFLEQLQGKYIPSLVINEGAYEVKYGTYELMEMKGLMQLFYFVLLIVVVSLVNIFLLSSKLKEKHIGMLTSIGATIRQIIGMSIWEVFLYSVLIIPIAYISSLIVMYLAFQVMYMIAPIYTNPFPYELVITPYHVLFVVLVNVVILLFCNLLPLIRFHNISAIQLIKNEGNNKIRKYRNYAYYEKLFGFPAQIAMRNRKRNRLSSISIMISSIGSVILLIYGYYIFVTYPIQSGFFQSSKIVIYAGIGIMMILLTIVNLYLLISSNIMLRSKEQMILSSIGMEKSQLLTMIFLENASTMIKSLILGIAISLYLNYQYVDPRFVTYTIDWPVILFVIVLFFVTTWFTMVMNYRKLIKMNIVENVRE